MSWSGPRSALRISLAPGQIRNGKKLMAKVILQNATKRFGKVTAANNIRLEAEDKEFLVLLGPLGCGKTTTLRMIAGVELADEGNVVIGDDIVNDVPPAARDIAMLFQNYALYRHMTARDNISFGLRLHNIPAKEIDDRIADAAQNAGAARLPQACPQGSFLEDSASVQLSPAPSCARPTCSSWMSHYPTWMRNCGFRRAKS